MSEPVIAYPPELPVSAARDEIAAAVRTHQVVIVAGATGSGKTTQLPKICLEMGRRRIAHTQPRRIAARSIAERVAAELQVPLGTTVGYKVRFTDTVSDDTAIALMTDGILLNEIHRDRLLRRYDTIIVDEAHERSLNVDFLLGYLHRILPRRPDLRVIITSATIDPDSFARHFADADGVAAPVIEVSGRTYPVDVRYRPRTLDAGPSGRRRDDEDDDDIEPLLAALRELDREPAGDVLVFLPGEAEIKDAADAVRGMYAKDARPTEVLPLYGRLSAAEQHRVFEPSTVAGLRRRVILATNVAETSLTVPGIRYVVDAGTARISRYSTRSKIQRLPIEPVSQASATQRSGRAGRTAPGIAIRLYSEDDFDGRPQFTDPEILRTSLAAVVLQMLSLGFGDIAAFPFLTPPDSRGVKAAFDLLTELGAVTIGPRRAARSPGGPHGDDARRRPTLTAVGRELSRLPIDPRFARMLVQARDTGVLPAVRAIVAGLSIPDVRERPEAAREEADRLHARFADPTSDFLALLNLWNHLQRLQHDLGSSAFRRTCRAEHLNYVRVREWFDVHRQLGTLLHAHRHAAPVDDVDPDAVHTAILAGLLSHIGVLDERPVVADARRGKDGRRKDRRPKAEYVGARGARFRVFPGSGLRAARPQALMAAELVETSRLYARTVAAIDPAWAEPLAGDLVRRSLSDPHWSKDAGAAVASEKVTLFGVEIVPHRRVQLARVDRALARELFLRHALVDGDWDVSAWDKRLSAFDRRNTELRRRLERREERERRRDILAGDDVVYAFYDARVPADVYDARAFQAWWRDAAGRTPRLLDMSEADLAGDTARSDERDFPTRWRQADQQLTLAYRFEPGAPDDGVTVVVPLALLAQLRPDGFDWQVPGLRGELITALIRALPKAIRRHVVPAADWAARFAEELAEQGPETHGGLPPASLRDALADRVRRVAGMPVTAADFDPQRVPAHLQVSFRAVDGRGRPAGSDRDLRALQQRLADKTEVAVTSSLTRRIGERGAAQRVRPGAPGRRAATTTAATGFVERVGLTAWDTPDLPDVVDVTVPGGVVRGYPALCDDGDTVSLRIATTPDDAAARTRAGVRRLLLLSSPSPAEYVLGHLTAAEKLALAASPYPSARAVVEDCRTAVADAVLGDTVIRTRTAFDRARDEFAARVVDELFAAVSLTSRILTAARDVGRAVTHANALTLLAALNDVTQQVAGLVHPGFVSATGLPRLAQLPRYLRGALLRVQTVPDAPGRDRQRMTELERAAALYVDAGGTIPLPSDAPQALVHVRWMLEEYRISLFAQQLGTAEPVSLPRIRKALAPQ